jgi:hypothetical protein
VLLQSLLLVATLAIIGSTLLTSALVSAKARFHASIVETGRSAMTDATADFIAWTQSNVRDNGIDQLPVWAAKPQTPNRQPACGGGTNLPTSAASSDCKLFQTIEWNVTGFTNPSDAFRSTAAGSEATNLATAQNERRISATVNIAITDQSGSVIYSRQSRELTARIFHAFPYVAVTGERDASSETSSIASAEGDTAGYLRQTNRSSTATNATSIATDPATLTDTTLVTTIDCVGFAKPLTLTAPLDNGAASFVDVRGYGNLVWSYEVPCIPDKPVNPSTAPEAYHQPQSSNYGNNSTMNDAWTKGDQMNTSFAY